MFEYEVGSKIFNNNKLSPLGKCPKDKGDAI